MLARMYGFAKHSVGSKPALARCVLQADTMLDKPHNSSRHNPVNSAKRRKARTDSYHSRLKKAPTRCAQRVDWELSVRTILLVHFLFVYITSTNRSKTVETRYKPEHTFKCSASKLSRRRRKFARCNFLGFGTLPPLRNLTIAVMLPNG